MQQMLDLGIEHVPREAARLLENDAPVLGIRVVAEVRAFVDEPLAFGVHHDAERIAVAARGDRPIELAEIGRIAFPRTEWQPDHCP